MHGCGEWRALIGQQLVNIIVIIIIGSSNKNDARALVGSFDKYSGIGVFDKYCIASSAFCR